MWLLPACLINFFDKKKKLHQKCLWEQASLTTIEKSHVCFFYCVFKNLIKCSQCERALSISPSPYPFSPSISHSLPIYLSLLCFCLFPSVSFFVSPLRRLFFLFFLFFSFGLVFHIEFLCSLYFLITSPWSFPPSAAAHRGVLSLGSCTTATQKMSPY